MIDHIVTHSGSPDLLWTRLLCLGLWISVAAFLIPGLSRYFRRDNAQVCDEWRVALFATAIIMVWNYALRIFAPTDTTYFVALNATTGALAVFILILIGQGRLK